ncbi:Serine/threonine-protein kinase RsbT [Gammaproteobacteria bacterium]
MENLSSPPVIPIHTGIDVLLARKVAREMAVALGLSTADQTRLATAVSELTRNVLQYAGSGQCRVTDESDATIVKIRVEVEDQGPGIPDVEQAMQNGYSTSGGLGVGLPGTRRLMDEFDIESKPGATRVMITMNRRRR